MDNKTKRRPWWEKRWRDKYCAITFCRLRHGLNIHGMSYCVKLKCDHSFYRSAFNNWIMNCENEIVTCPSCRIPISIEEIVEL